MTEAIIIEAPATEAVPSPALRKVVLYGASSVYQGALKCLLESRLQNLSVQQLVDEAALLETAANVIVCDRDVETMTQMELGEFTAMLHKVAPRPVLLITGGTHPSVLQTLLREGLAGVIMESSPCETLLDAVESVAAGKVWLERELLAETFGESSHQRTKCSEANRIAQLTQREREIIAVAASGLLNRQIAQKMHISEATVRHHLTSVLSLIHI